MKKKAQQEMVGFVLIVVIVIVAMMVLLIISLRKPTQVNENVEADNLLSALMKYTTACAINYEPDYDSVRDLIKSCQTNKKCNNLDVMACDYMNETLREVMHSVWEGESAIKAYQLSLLHFTHYGDIGICITILI